jgi:spermidine/putrescine transport system permease protein
MGPILHIIAGLTYIFLFMPIISLVLLSFNQGALTSFPMAGFSLRWYEVFWNNRGAWAALRTSVLVAVVTSIATTVLATLAAIGLVRLSFKGKGLLQSLLMLPIVIPHLVFGINLLMFFKFINLAPSVITVATAHIVLALPFAVMLISTSLSGLDVKLEEAAKDLGASEWRTFRRVVLPLIAPGIISAAMIAFTISFDEFVLTFFVSGRGLITLPLYLYSEIRFQVTPEVNAISTVVLGISLIFIGLTQWAHTAMRARH